LPEDSRGYGQECQDRLGGSGIYRRERQGFRSEAWNRTECRSASGVQEGLCPASSSLGGGAILCLEISVPPPGTRLRAAAGNPRGNALPRLRLHHACQALRTLTLEFITPSRFKGSSDGNFYAYCGNDPINYSDPLGLDRILIYMHGTLQNNETDWSSDDSSALLRNAKARMKPDKMMAFDWSGSDNVANASVNEIKKSGESLKDFLSTNTNPYDVIILLGYSNGANVALYGANRSYDCDNYDAGRVVGVIRLGGPNSSEPEPELGPSDRFWVHNVYDPNDAVVNSISKAVGWNGSRPTGARWRNFPVDAPGMNGVTKHVPGMRSFSAWQQYIKQFEKRFGRKANVGNGWWQ
jgi:hypothetical protein